MNTEQSQKTLAKKIEKALHDASYDGGYNLSICSDELAETIIDVIRYMIEDSKK